MRDLRLPTLVLTVLLLGCGHVPELEPAVCSDGLTNVGMPCTQDADCPCAECIAVGDGSRVCSATCQLASDCLAGWRCGRLNDDVVLLCVCEASPEVCDDIDNDCDGKVDVDAPGLPAAYADVDGDGFGDPMMLVRACHPAAGYVDNDADCDDTDGPAHPGADERCNGGDDDCDGTADEGLGVDTPCDGQDTDSCKEGTLVCGAAGDVVCTDATGNTVEQCNGVDDDCDGVVPANEADADGDGYRVCQGDCNDANPSIHPGAIEICDGVDQNCSGAADEGLRGALWRDADGDGYGNPNAAMGNACPQAGWVANASDCYDSNSNAHPGQSGWFATHRGDGSYDYNCANGDELESAVALACDLRGAPGCYAAPQVGWEFNVPGCGQSGRWVAQGCYSYIDELDGQQYCATAGSASSVQRCH